MAASTVRRVPEGLCNPDKQRLDAIAEELGMRLVLESRS